MPKPPQLGPFTPSSFLTTTVTSAGDINKSTPKSSDFASQEDVLATSPVQVKSWPSQLSPASLSGVVWWFDRSCTGHCGSIKYQAHCFSLFPVRTQWVRCCIQGIKLSNCPVGVGLYQSCPLSPILFVVFMIPRWVRVSQSRVGVNKLQLCICPLPCRNQQLLLHKETSFQCRISSAFFFHLCHVLTLHPNPNHFTSHSLCDVKDALNFDTGHVPVQTEVAFQKIISAFDMKMDRI